MIEKAGDKIADVGTTLITHVTVPIAAAGTAAVKTAADFDSAMSKVAAVSGATGDELDALRDKAREMGAKTKFSASEAADAMNYMAMAGWKTGEMLKGIEGIMNLAAASGEDLATTSDIVTDALTALGLSAADSGHFADVLAAASSNANTNVSMMGETFKYCAPVAGSLGLSCEDTAQAIGLMANSGIKSSQAGSSLRAIMTALAGDVKFCGAAIGEMEIAATNQDGSMRELNDILADCRVAFAQMSESEQASAAQALVGKNAMSGFLALMNAAPSDIQKLEGAISTCSDEIDGYNGVTEKMAAVMQDNLGGQLTILKSQLQELAISFGEILMPAIRAIVSKIQGLIDKFNGLSPATKETIVKIALIAAALGPLLIIVGKTIGSVGKLMQFVSNIPTIIAGAKTAFSTFGAAIGGISAPVIAVVAVIGTLVAAFTHLWKTNEEFRNNITAIWTQIKDTFHNFTQGIVDRLNALGFNFKNISEVIKAIWDGLCKFLKPLFEGVFKEIADVFKFITDTILSILDIFIGIFTGDWSRVWEGIKGIFTGIWDFIVSTIKNVFNTLDKIFGGALSKIKDVVVNVLTAIKNFFVNIWTAISNKVKEKVEFIKLVITTVWNAIHRVVLAYELQIKVDPTKLKLFGWNFANIPDNEYKKNAEVYEFYAGYKESQNAIPDGIETYSIGEKQAVVTDNGYYKNISIDSDNPHLGWDIGEFKIGGFTNHTKNSDGETVFLKNVGDKVMLWFNMTDGININKLNNNSYIYINNDTNGYDQKLNVPMQNFKHGALIIRFTDYKGQKHDPIIYTNFLEAIASPGAETKVQLFEEGDYEVSLDYEIINTNWKDRIYNYKIAFNFHIRNSNTIVYPKDIETGTYLANDAVTENGFVLDWAKSRYLDVNVKLSQWTKGVNGYTEDIRYNRTAKESDTYKDTGIYTITVTNPTTDPYGNNPTVKKIYVGSDNVLIASMNAKNASYSINDIANLVDNEGYKISATGELIPPADLNANVTTAKITTSQSTTISLMSNTTSLPDTTKISITTVAPKQSDNEKGKSNGILIFGICGVVAALIILIIRKKAKKAKQ